MTKYKYVRTALTICQIHFGFSEEQYKERFESFLKNGEPAYTDSIRKDIRLAMNDPEWSWKEVAKEVEFYAYDE